MGFATDILFLCALGLILLGPKRLPALLAQIARAKGHLETATQSFRAQLLAKLEAQSQMESGSSKSENRR